MEKMEKMEKVEKVEKMEKMKVVCGLGFVGYCSCHTAQGFKRSRYLYRDQLARNGPTKQCFQASDAKYLRVGNSCLAFLVSPL